MDVDFLFFAYIYIFNIFEIAKFCLLLSFSIKLVKVFAGHLHAHSFSNLKTLEHCVFINDINIRLKAVLIILML